MAEITLLSIVLLLVALLLFAWRERGRAIEKARLAEAEARRARQIDSAAADAADLLAAALTSLRLARDNAPREAETTERWIADAERATRDIAALLESARVYARDADVGLVGGAGGYVRLAVAIARAEGRGVQLKGDGTELACAGAPRDAIALFSELIEILTDAGRAPGYVTVVLSREAVTVIAPRERGVDLTAVEPLAARLAWAVTPSASATEVTIVVTPADAHPGAPTETGRAPVPGAAAGTMRAS
jgi:hypothetical protein